VGQVLNPAHQALLRITVLSVAFISGFAIMCVELIGGRILSPYFGSSVYVWGSIITVFMLSLSFGYLAGGKLSTLNPSPVTYSLFFIVAAILIFPIILFSNGIMEQVFLAIEDPRYGSLVASVALFFLPTSILGMISPYSIRLLVQNENHSGHVAGQLYFVATLGSALGTMATSFYFVLWFEVNQILLGTILTLIAAGLLVLAVYYLPQRSATGAGQYES